MKHKFKLTRLWVASLLLLVGVSQPTWAATKRYIYCGISNQYQTYKNGNQFGFNFWGGTSDGGVRTPTWIQDKYTWDNRDYTIYRVEVGDDNNKAQFKGNDSWYIPDGGFSVTLNGTTKNAVFFSASEDGWLGQFQENYQVTSTASLTPSSSTTTTGTQVTLTPALTSNTEYNDIKSTAYSVTTNPSSAGSVSNGKFSATKAGTYVVKATITYNAKGFTGITKTVDATTTITVEDPLYTGLTIADNPSGYVTKASTLSANQVVQGQSVTITKGTPKTGYEFKDITVTSGGTISGTTWTPSANNQTATVNWKAKEYAVNFVGSNFTPSFTSGTKKAYNSTVSFTLNLDQDYAIDGVTAKDASDNNVLVTNNAGTYSFTMPNSAVTVSVATHSTAVTTYTIRFLNYNGTVLQSGLVEEGNIPVYSGATPTKPSDAEWDYTFNTWTPAIAAATQDKDYTATYLSSRRKYTLTWDYAGGSVVSEGTPAGQVANASKITAPTLNKTGYTFTGWSPEFTGTMPASDVTYTAQWTENKYNVTINTNLPAGASLKFGSTSKEWGSVANVGIDSKQAITVTLNAGYKYDGAFSVTGGAHVSGSGSSFTVWADGADGTITVNIAEDLSSNWYLVGNTSLFPGGWDAKEASMMKRASGHSTENVYYFTIHVDDKDIKGSGQESTYQFKIRHYKKDECNDYFGWSTGDTHFWVNKTCSTGVYTGDGNGNNLYFIPTIAGDYEFKVDATGANPELTVTWPVYNCVYGEFDSWNKDAHKLDFAGGDEASTVVNITDISKSYQFLVLVNSNYLTNNTSFTTPITRSTASNVAFAAKGGSDNNAKFTPDIAGDYTFTYNKSTNKLTITYPALPTASTSSTEKRMFNEDELDFIESGDGTEGNPYKIYTDEKLTISIAALAAQTNLTAKYQFGDEAATTDVLSKTITNPSTEETSIVVKAFYESDGVTGTAWEKTIYYQGVATPSIALSTTPNEYDILIAPDEVMISYRATNYSGSATITKDGDSWQTPSSASENYEDQLGQTLQTHTYVATATTNGRTFTSTLVVSVYKMVKVKVADENSLFTRFYMWRDGSDQTGPAWPGETFSYQVGTTHIFYVKYPTFDRFVLNNGKAPEEQDAAQTVDVEIPAEDACYTIGEKITAEGDDKGKYACASSDCPNGLYVKDIDPVAALVGEGVLVSPQVDIEPGLDESSLTITFDYKTATGISCDQRGRSFMVTATQAASKTQTIEVTYSIEGAEPVTKQVQINVTEAIMIQAKYGNLGWSDHNRIYIHYWGTGVDATINMTWKDYVDNIDRVYARIPLDSEHQINFQIYAWNMDDDKQWHITKNVENVTEAGCYTITSDGENVKRNIAKDGTGLCWTAYYVEVDMNNGTVYRSNTVESSTETVSFFAPGASETGYKQGLVRIMENGTPKGEVASSTFTQSGVYTAKITTGGEGLSDVAPYTGDYYIRTDGADGHWDNYKTNADNKFIKFDKIESSTYDRYWVKNLKHADDKTNVNIQACVANDYNENLANKIVSSSYTDGNGDVFPDINGVNVRFGYDPSTNNFERAIIMGAASDAFLNVIGDNNNVYKEKECQTLLNEQNEDSKFADKEQWIYEKDVYVKIDDSHTHAKAKLQSQDFNGNVMYQLGYEIDPNTGKATTTPKTFGLIAQGTTNGVYKIHLVYDFKTNRMVSGWTPEGEISGNIVLDADMLLVRNHQEKAQQIHFSNNSVSISKIKHIYGVMEIEKDKMTAAASATMYELHLYWISFPFDVKVSSIFGVGTYGKEWKLQRYDGAERASKGWFKGDGTTTFWKDMTLDETMNANEGYILSLKPAEFDNEKCEIWNHGRTVAAFYFPSVLDNVGLIKAATYEQNVPEHECKIDREFEVENVGTVNHKNTDSHWNVIGVPAFEDAAPQTSSEGFHSVYRWIPSTNTYEAQVVSTDFKLQTMYAYMVQYAGTINWQNVSVITKAPYQYADAKNYMIELFFGNGEAEDHTYINLADEASTDFVLNEDMMKIDNAGFPNIYSFAGAYNVAYNGTKFDNQTVMLGVSAPKNGTYTFAMPKDFSGKALLVDLESGETTDLNMSDYTVELNKGTYNNRFQLVLEVEAKAPTAIDNVDGGLWRVDGKTKKLLINDQIYLINGGRVYNAMGVER